MTPPIKEKLEQNVKRKKKKVVKKSTGFGGLMKSYEFTISNKGTCPITLFNETR